LASSAASGLPALIARIVRLINGGGPPELRRVALLSPQPEDQAQALLREPAFPQVLRRLTLDLAPIKRKLAQAAPPIPVRPVGEVAFGELERGSDGDGEGAQVDDVPAFEAMPDEGSDASGDDDFVARAWS
jgi:hypothetical protein